MQDYSGETDEPAYPSFLVLPLGHPVNIFFASDFPPILIELHFLIPPKKKNATRSRGCQTDYLFIGPTELRTHPVYSKYYVNLTRYFGDFFGPWGFGAFLGNFCRFYPEFFPCGEGGGFGFFSSPAALPPGVGFILGIPWRRRLSMQKRPEEGKRAKGIRQFEQPVRKTSALAR